MTKENDIVLDTFCGTSVTGYETIRLGRKYIGFDNNPIAILISKAKLLFPETGTLYGIFEEIFKDPFLTNRNFKNHPNEVFLKKWYHSETYSELNMILSIIRSISNPILQIPAQAVFSSILKKTSSQGKHWGWVCDNVVPKPDEIIYKNVIEIFNKALKAYCNYVDETLIAIKQRNGNPDRKDIRQKWNIECTDTITSLSKMPEDEIDLILTSPPYYGVADYVKAQRLSFLWFHEDVLKVEGYGYSDFENLRKKETGARSKRYNIQSFVDYMKYMESYISDSFKVLKPNGFLVLIIGDSKARSETLKLIDDSAVKTGFRIEFEFERQIRESRRRLMAKVEKETVKVFSKNV